MRRPFWSVLLIASLAGSLPGVALARTQAFEARFRRFDSNWQLRSSGTSRELRDVASDGGKTCSQGGSLGSRTNLNAIAGAP